MSDCHGGLRLVLAYADLEVPLSIAEIFVVRYAWMLGHVSNDPILGHESNDPIPSEKRNGYIILLPRSSVI